jgi:hypothetical protein
MSTMDSRLLKPIASRQSVPFATLVSNHAGVAVSGNAKSTTGYIRVEYWDGSHAVHGTGIPTTSLGWFRNTFGFSGSKTIRIYPSNSSGIPAGALTEVNCGFLSLTSLDVSGLTALTVLSASHNQLTSLNVSGLTALTALYCNNNQLTSLNPSGLTQLRFLFCYSNQIPSLNVSGLTQLQSLLCFANQLTTLNVSGLNGLVTLACQFNSLTSLGLGSIYALQTLNCSNNSLTSLALDDIDDLSSVDCSHNNLTFISADSVALDSGKYRKHKKKFIASGNLSHNSLTAPALNYFYGSLAGVAPGTGYLNVFNNPGVPAHTPSIATAKGYVVFV